MRTSFPLLWSIPCLANERMTLPSLLTHSQTRRQYDMPRFHAMHVEASTLSRLTRTTIPFSPNLGLSATYASPRSLAETVSAALAIRAESAMGADSSVRFTLFLRFYCMLDSGLQCLIFALKYKS
ncbi:uncharacterized protein EV420DRAFT_368095 [Desarmillaria tabescens]|uniref:Uncharacterized protein n=1 Tax=Armillaria tabescens TaxID=1929756 RepID=A0AA39KCH5_ARMTA|nr:uncharacterized protein EV420DRAFT_368095 [Desarmillaria tabescens]KAK0458624.1 hypothetical protein EV420DRAFT_368095 [Desarmillaria tabescens]